MKNHLTGYCTYQLFKTQRIGAINEEIAGHARNDILGCGSRLPYRQQSGRDRHRRAEYYILLGLESCIDLTYKLINYLKPIIPLPGGVRGGFIAIPTNSWSFVTILL